MENEEVEKFYLDKDRIAVFIGKGGKEKEKFEETLGFKIDINSKNGEVSLENNEDTLNTFLFSNMISAINHGQNPENALLLMDENIVINFVDVRDYLRNQDKSKLKKIMGRIIGKGGITRGLIEEITKCKISISDSLVCIIGEYENAITVQKAIRMLVEGCAHKTFYSYLEKNKQNINTNLL